MTQVPRVLSFGLGMSLKDMCPSRFYWQVVENLRGGAEWEDLGTGDVFLKMIILVCFTSSNPAVRLSGWVLPCIAGSLQVPEQHS